MIKLALYDLDQRTVLPEHALVPVVPVPGPNTFVCMGFSIYVVESITYTGFLIADETEPRVTACVRLYAGQHPIPRETRIR